MIFDTGEVVIHDLNYRQFIDPVHDGEVKKCGTVRRPLDTHPVGCYAGIRPFHAVDMPLVDQGQWQAALDEQTAAGRLCSDFRNRGMGGKPIPSRDQNGKGYCWAHSGTSAHLVVRARENQPYADLSAFSVACPIKNFADEGGWGPQGVDYQQQNGIATSKTWPQQSMSRACVAASAQERLLYKIDEGWIDLQVAEYDRNLSWLQNVSCSLRGEPGTVDYNWWSHSVCRLDLVNGAAQFHRFRNAMSGKKVSLNEFHQFWDMHDPVTAGFGLRIWNSWADTWSQNGTGILAPSKAVPDGSVALRTVTATAA